jgi:hypothetical protein
MLCTGELHTVPMCPALCRIPSGLRVALVCRTYILYMGAEASWDLFFNGRASTRWSCFGSKG